MGWVIRPRVVPITVGTVLLGAAMLSSCAAPDAVGLTADEKGQVSVQNCGTWISAVRVVDPSTGTPIWSTEASTDDAGAIRNTVAEVKLGQAPPGWAEAGSRPTYGQPLVVLVESSLSDPRRLAPDPAALPAGALFYDGRYRDGSFTDYCAPFYPYQGWVYPTLGIVGLGAIAVLVIVGITVHKSS